MLEQHLDRSSELTQAVQRAGKPRENGEGWLRREGSVLAAAFCIDLWAGETQRGARAIDDAMAEMRRIERIASADSASSELSWLNRQAHTVAVQLSDETFRLVERALAFSKLSGGAFDISCAAVARLYDHNKRTAPDAASLLRALPLVGFDKLLLDPIKRSLRFARQGMRVDFGGLIKGHAVDSAVSALLRHGVQHACVSLGNHCRAIGERGGRPWRVNLGPRGCVDAPPARMPLRDGAASSVDDGRYFEIDGKRHRALVDARTGRSTSGVRCVTVLTGDCLSSEALAKSAFLLGSDKGLQLLEGLPGVQSWLLDAAGRWHRTGSTSSIETPAALIR